MVPLSWDQLPPEDILPDSDVENEQMDSDAELPEMPTGGILDFI